MIRKSTYDSAFDLIKLHDESVEEDKIEDCKEDINNLIKAWELFHKIVNQQENCFMMEAI